MKDKYKLLLNMKDLNVDFVIENSPRQIFNVDVECIALVDDHFRNFCFQQESVYSCAVDCFLEISYRIILQHLNQISGSAFFESMVIYGSLEYNDDSNIGDRNNNSVLSEVREASWTNIIQY